jgi:hypothetical protein
VSAVVGRESFVIIELDQDECTHEYGVAPCTAAVGVTGVRKCFKTCATCQDTTNYNKGVKTIRFCQPADNLPRDINLIPSVLGFTSAPAELNIGTGDTSGPLGTRASVTITFTDHPHHDRGIDPYWRERDYDPMENGTFWGKWLARTPYYQGRNIRVLYGYVGEEIADMKRRHYVIEKINGPTGGSVQITAKDPIKLLDFVRAQAPFASAGVLSTTVDELSTQMEIDVSGFTGDDAYPTSGLGVLNGELIKYERTGNVFVFVQRAMHGTKISNGKIGETFQQALEYSRERVDLVIQDLLLRFTDFPSEFINATDWEDEVFLWAPSLIVSAIITEPTGVADLISELMSQTLCYIWWDELEQRLRLRVLRPRLPQIDEDPTAIDYVSNMVAGKTAITDKPDDRVTQVWIYYGKIDPTGGDDEKNYARLRVRFDADAESANQYNEQRIKTIFARWLGSGNDSSALVLTIRLLQRFRDTPKTFDFSLDMKDDNFRVADYVDVTHPDVVDFTGQPKKVTLQITSLEEVESGHRNQLSSRLAPDVFLGGAFTVADGTVDYDVATSAARLDGAWISQDDGTFPNGDAAYRII